MTVYEGPHELPSYGDFLDRHCRWFRELEPRRGERTAYKAILVCSLLRVSRGAMRRHCRSFQTRGR